MIVIISIAIAGAAGWYVLHLRDAAPAQAPPAPSVTAADPPAQQPTIFPPAEPIELPPLDSSDGFVRRLVAQLSAHPQFARWLVTDELVRRFVLTVADLADGSSPARHLRFMAPRDSFAVREAAGDVAVDPSSFRRYDLIAELFASLDVERTARLIRDLQPLFEETHHELGLPDRTFDGDLTRAFANLLAVRVPASPTIVVRGDTGWEYADPELEGRSAAAKHMLRLGPDNARRVQAKLAELADALGIQRT